MLLVPLVFWFTGSRAWLPGHLPFCASASISVPGAPASSLATGSQLLVSKPGVEICAPDWLATALLCTDQPPAPRSVRSLAPVGIFGGPGKAAVLAAVLAAVSAAVGAAVAAVEAAMVAAQRSAAERTVPTLATDRRTG